MDWGDNFFFPGFVVSQGFGVAWAYTLWRWLKKDYGGLKFAKKGTEQSHSFVMAMVMIVFGCELLLYRFMCQCSRKLVGYLFTYFCLIPFLVFLVGLKFAHDAVEHDKTLKPKIRKGYAHFESIHGQIGVVMTIFTILVFIFGWKAATSKNCCQLWLYTSVTSYLMWFAFLCGFVCSMVAMHCFSIFVSPKNFNIDLDRKIVRLNRCRYFGLFYCLMVISMTLKFDCGHQSLDECSNDIYLC